MALIVQDIIPLEEAKDYLGLDDNSRDVEVARMSKAAIRWVENRTNHIFIEKEKEYPLNDGCVRVYDFPLALAPDGINEITKPTYSVITSDNVDDESLTLTSGYQNLEDIPEDLIEVAYLVLKFFFYEQEGKGNIPESITTISDAYRRFII